MIGRMEPAGPAGYRPDIDGLRAVAVLAVLAFHAAPTLVPGGFVGVDVFFVISGFLITSLLLAEREAGGIRLGRFYARRIRRIFPALLIVLATSTLIAWLILPQDDLQRFGSHLAASAAFVPNFAFASGSGYFSQPYSNPLLHLWSLGVEEQYYAVWPLLLILLAHLRRPLLGIVLLGLASFLVNLTLTFSAPPEAFYSPLSRGWELMLGGSLAAVPASWRAPPPAAKNIAAWTGLLCVTAGFWLIRPGQPFPGFWALLPTIGTFLLIAAGPHAWLNRQLLSRRIAVAIGLISYPLYLWHWPLMSFAASLTLDGLPWTWRLAVVALSCVLAALTYRVVERPIRRRPARPLPLAAAMAAMLLAGFLIHRALVPLDLRPAIDPRRSFVAHYRNLPLLARGKGEPDCEFGNFFTGLRRRTLPPACITPGPSATWLLWGDSHGRSLAPGLRRALPSSIGLAQVTTGGCPPLMGGRRVCRFSDSQALDLVRRLRPRLVLLAQAQGHEDRDWPALARRLRALGAGQVILLGPLPRWQRPLPQIVVSRYWPDLPRFVGTELRPEPLISDARLRARFAGERSLRYLSLTDSLCRGGACLALVPATDPAILMTFDDGHLTPAAALFLARTLILPAIASE